ncbi:helix-turn-helix domain-containing protein [Nocardioides sp. GXQ0305]|uniref:helix-turn-helix domain-containing protein n=1 Tax=Nocardioides sp. GXQ0305 TaxID=3423912 RepID=UPI003D7C8476
MGDLVPIRPVVEPGSSEPRAVEPLWREAVGQLLRDRRHERGEKLSETAGRAGVSTQYLSEVERGRKEPSSEVLSAVAGALDLTLLDLTAGVARRLSVPGPATAGHRSGTPLALALAA